MINIKQSLVLAILIFTSISAGAATLLVNEDGQLTGATGVDVGGTLYDVAFLDGTCIEIFNGCDGPADFTFTSNGAGEEASMALLDQVLINVPLGQFDSIPALTNGIDATSYAWILTPEFTSVEPTGDVLVWSSIAWNDIAEDEDRANSFTTTIAGESLNMAGFCSDRCTYARWDVSAVPLPAAGYLFVAALAGLIANRRFSWNKTTY